ncbi:MAG: hypothetical protein K6U89_20220, partial [Chloroflexi bacterium]|nr:hypothetical protein [Chloroflexota bacterium]
ANLLPLLIQLDDLAAALLTEPEFDLHCHAVGGTDLDDLSVHLERIPGGAEVFVKIIWPDGTEEEVPVPDGDLSEVQRYLADYEDIAAATLILLGADGKVREFPIHEGNVDDLRLDLRDFNDLAYAIVSLYGADGLLREFPIRDGRLRRLLQTILDHDPEYYAQLIHAALRISDYRHNHPGEPDLLCEDPILLNDLLSVEEERARVGLVPEQQESGLQTVGAAPGSEPAINGQHSAIPRLPIQRSGELMRSAMGALPAARQAELSQELQLLYLQEAAYAGGSFALADLENAASRVQTYLQMGLSGLAEGETEAASRLLMEQRLRTLMESGARQVERMRQVALRLLPWHEVLDRQQVRLLEGLKHPDVGMDEGGQPVLRLPSLPGTRERTSVPLEAVPGQLEAIRAWVTLVKAVGKERVARHMSEQDAPLLARRLVVGAILYRRWEPDLVEPKDLERCRETYLDPATGRFSAAAFRALAEATRDLTVKRKLQPNATEEIARFLAATLDQIAATA